MGDSDSAKFTFKRWPLKPSTNGCCKQQACLFAVHLFYVRKPTTTFYCYQMHCLQSFTYGNHTSPTLGRFECITLSASKIQEFFLSNGSCFIHIWVDFNKIYSRNDELWDRALQCSHNWSDNLFMYIVGLSISYEWLQWNKEKTSFEIHKQVECGAVALFA